MKTIKAATEGGVHAPAHIGAGPAGASLGSHLSFYELYFIHGEVLVQEPWLSPAFL